MNRDKKMYERDDDFHKYVAMAEKSPSEMLALIAREQDDSRERREKYRKMDDDRHNVVVTRLDSHCADANAHHPAPTRRNGNGGKVVVNVGDKEGGAKGAAGLGFNAKEIIIIVGGSVALAVLIIQGKTGAISAFIGGG
jgi:hypothetical protein